MFVYLFIGKIRTYIVFLLDTLYTIWLVQVLQVMWGSEVQGLGAVILVDPIAH